MKESLRSRIGLIITQWLMHNVDKVRELPLSDFQRIQEEIHLCDVLLIEGRSRVSSVIKSVTQSPWSHAAIYIGRNYDIQDPELRKKIDKFYQGNPSDRLLIESVMGKGVTVTPLSHYKNEHIRICRPNGLTRKDSQRVIEYVIDKLGIQYDIRHILDLLRFLLPWSIFPRRWRSTLFSHNAGEQTKLSCSLLLAEAFHSVHFPILPIIKISGEMKYELKQLNPRLYTPSDFDYSPFFTIIKYPIVELTDTSVYHMLRAKYEAEEKERVLKVEKDRDNS